MGECTGKRQPGNIETCMCKSCVTDRFETPTLLNLKTLGEKGVKKDKTVTRHDV